MKISVNIIPQPPLFLRFCVRMLCFILLFTFCLIESKTPFYHSDSTIYISQEASFYKEPQTIVSVTTPVDIESSDSRPPVYHKAKTLKSKLKSAPVTVYTVDKKGSSFCFTAPAGSQQFSSTGSFSVQAVTGDYFFRKLFRQVISSALPKLHGIISVKKKPFGLAFYPIRVIKISLQQYSRPPPLI